MKKIITWSIILVMLFNFIFCNIPVYAEDPDGEESKDSAYTEPAPVSNTVGTDLLTSGSVSQKQGSTSKTTVSLGSIGVSAIGMVTGILALLIDILVVQVDAIMASMTITDESGDTPFWFTIDRVVFNRVALFNINYFDTEDTYKVGDLEIASNPSNIAIKEGITGIFYMCRMLAMIILLLVLIYIGIRMALSTVASDQAKYKKMLVSWVESLVLVFVMIYIMAAVMYLGEMITGAFYEIRCQLIDSDAGYGVFEDTVREQIMNAIFNFSGLNLTIWSIIYWCLLFMQIKFFWLYAKRLLMVGLLIIVSPLITITYSIDKVGDGRAQVFSSWLKEFIVNVLIQPLHALIYMIFILTANAIALESPLVALALLMSMGTVEKMVKVVFDLRGLSALKDANEFLKKK